MVRERESGREREQSGAFGSGDGGVRGRVLLVADLGASKLLHARHAAGELCRLAMAARASGLEVRPRPASAPFPFSMFFEFLFLILVLNSFGLFKNPFHLWLPKQSCSK